MCIIADVYLTKKISRKLRLNYFNHIICILQSMRILLEFLTCLYKEVSTWNILGYSADQKSVKFARAHQLLDITKFITEMLHNLRLEADPSKLLLNELLLLTLWALKTNFFYIFFVYNLRLNEMKKTYEKSKPPPNFNKKKFFARNWNFSSSCHKLLK